jgi:hypothetical protein
MDADEPDPTPPNLPWLNYVPPDQSFLPSDGPAPDDEPVARRRGGWRGLAVVVGVLLVSSTIVAVTVVASHGPAPADAGSASPTAGVLTGEFRVQAWSPPVSHTTARTRGAAP